VNVRRAAWGRSEQQSREAAHARHSPQPGTYETRPAVIVNQSASDEPGTKLLGRRLPYHSLVHVNSESPGLSPQLVSTLPCNEPCSPW
jgi:hypothetical protein